MLRKQLEQWLSAHYWPFCNFWLYSGAYFTVVGTHAWVPTKEFKQADNTVQLKFYRWNALKS